MIQPRPPVDVRLSRDLRRLIRRGHPWVLADALNRVPRDVAPGTQARLADKQGKPLARGFLDPTSHLAFRVCVASAGRDLDAAWVAGQLERAVSLRRALFQGRDTDAYRLVNGEGDGLPGLVVDRYGAFAVIKLDGAGPEGFYDAPAVARWLVDALGLSGVVQRMRGGGEDGEVVAGAVPDGSVTIVEHGHRFLVDLRRGQKTGFYLDQRENRRRVQRLAGGLSVLNVFGYTGGFSVYAGHGGASHVTTVDRAVPAIDAARANWTLNGLPEDRHDGLAVDAFGWLDGVAAEGRRWDMVIVDPPALAPGKQALPQALEAYRRLTTAGARVTAPDGLLVAASCTAHVDLTAFLGAIEDGVGQARRRAVVLSTHGQPPDHPAPLPCPELRYLKCVFLRVT